MLEEWKPIMGFDRYFISNYGRVKSYRQGKEKILSVRKNTQGRHQVRLRKDGRHVDLQVHRLVLEAFVGPCPEEHECRHLDGNCLNNRIDNLAWGTRSENMKDKVLHGTTSTTSNSKLRKFSPQEIFSMRKERAEGKSYPALAASYGCTMRTVELICKRRTYKDLP